MYKFILNNVSRSMYKQEYDQLTNTPFNTNSSKCTTVCDVDFTYTKKYQLCNLSNAFVDKSKENSVNKIFCTPDDTVA